MSLTIKLGSAAFIGPALYRASQGLNPQIVQTLQDMDDAAFIIIPRMRLRPLPSQPFPRFTRVDYL